MGSRAGHLGRARAAEAIAAYVRAKLDFSRKHAAQSRMFANEAVHGGRFLSRKDRAHMLAVTLAKAGVFAAWAEAGKMDRVDPSHLFIMLWATTRYYADFEVLAQTHLETRRLRGEDFERAAATIIAVVLKGCGITAADPASAAEVAPPCGRGALSHAARAGAGRPVRPG
jgi:hypothetical protein